jgi:serine/threonine-protein kinase
MLRLPLLALGILGLALGAWSLGAHFAPDHAALALLDKGVRGALKAAGLGGKAKLLIGIVPGAALSGVGLLLAFAGLGAKQPEASGRAAKGEPVVQAPKLSDRAARKAGKAAAVLAKQGDLVGAGELCHESGLHDQAVTYFVKAQEFGKAADVRQDQNRFEDAAELLVQAGRFDNAGALYASRSHWEKAADCYRKGGRMSVAAEMYEKAGRLALAGECYMRCEFYRHAAQSFLKVQDWKRAAGAVEKALEEELASPATGQDKEKAKELRKLVLQAGKLHEEAGDVEAALNALVRGECWAAAADLADRSGLYERAADFHQRAGNVPKAAEALRKSGESGAAAQLLGEHLRDKGREDEAAHLLLEAGDFGAAADLYRNLEDWKRAGECYERGGDGVRAAEMFRLCDEWDRAATCYEKVRHFKEAAECAAQLGDARREARYLAQATAFLPAARVLWREGHDEDAIKLLQQVAPEAPEFREAAALLGEIFVKKGKHSLAQKKIEQAIGNASLSPATLELYFQLAAIREASGQAAPAAELYEKILAIDYHFRDVESRLERVREQVAADAQAPGASPQDPTAPQQKPARYRIDRELGRGGMGIVYQAHDLVLDRTVALKVLPDSLRDNPQALKNFLREAKAAAKLNHPNIVTVYDAGEQGDATYIAMEYVDGTTLKAIVRQRGAIAARALVQVLIQMCDGLQYAHAQKVIHRDVKTANVMWAKDKKVKLMDFGLAKVVEDVLNHTTHVSGTPYYMSPEQTRGSNVDHRTDLYSLGVTAFELATGVLPFREGNVPYHHVHTPPPDPRSIRTDVPQALAELILACLEKDPDKRPQSAQDVGNSLRAMMR